MVMSDGLTHVI